MLAYANILPQHTSNRSSLYREERFDVVIDFDSSGKVVGAFQEDGETVA